MLVVKQIHPPSANDFLVVLKEDSKTKTQILKKIFGTGILTSFQKSLEERLRQSNKDMEKRQAQLGGHLPVSSWLRSELLFSSKHRLLKISTPWKTLAQRQENLMGVEKHLKGCP